MSSFQSQFFLKKVSTVESFVGIYAIFLLDNYKGFEEGVNAVINRMKSITRSLCLSRLPFRLAAFQYADRICLTVIEQTRPIPGPLSDCVIKV